jgi:hypothetical protein
MVNLHEVTTGKTQQLQRIERKFFVLPRNIDFARTLLRQVCAPDRDYPSEQINSLYFDTWDLDQHERSTSGDLRKNKIRIRWYHTSEEYRDKVPVFLELKSREGFASSKQRQKVLVPAHQLEPHNLHEGIVPGTMLVDTLATFGYFLEAPIRPVIAISYWRYRFTELDMGMRIALDVTIRSTLIDRSFGHEERDLKLAGGIIEVKGRSLELPATMRRMKLLDIDWTRFSKYSSCLDSHLSEIGDITRLWPTGRIL